MLGNAVAIRLDNNITNEAEQEASRYLLESISYANESLIGRARHVVAEQFSFFSSYSEYEKYYNRAEILIVQGKYKEAINELNLAYLSAGDIAEGTEYITDDIWVKKGCLYALLNDYSSAVDCFENVTAGSGFSEDVVTIETQIFLEMADIDRAVNTLREYLDTEENVMLRQTLAEIYYMEGEYKSAGETYSLLLSKTSQNMEYYHLMRGICLEQTGQYQQAIPAQEIE